ncbi:efflux RND transporter periplasmic adaptor subunit [Pseudomonas sp. 5P_3.1_Bac2]|uniref:efflux RND transporter periplasmic adaptor subunit n=1 Tax=Pseudomonas sp. 5P_3.1_Bac2 TaxID=2971617 RepID=UPI0021CA6E80|nr:efflux RND transporter periplasmic adaptor subunit [Pseudomonas sp. 5P_3.1_Bac2]MCU1719471.1 efflux RND transporter periplasmic adaptor subunit [Pseudomonas sp. 5P_3.1_Bac2]
MLSKPTFAVLVSAVTLTALTLTACKEASAPPPQQTPQVGVVTLQTQPYALTTQLPGRTSAYRIAEVRPQVNGILQKRLFSEGSDVKAGQQLYQIDPATYQATYKSTQATELSASALAKRYELLVKDKAVSQQAYDEARAAALQAQAAVEQAQIDLRYTKVLAPISGRIGRSLSTEGALVSNAQANALATIQQLDPIYVDVTQSTKELLTLRKELSDGRLSQAGDNAAKVRLKLEDGSTFAHEGKLEFSDVSVDEGTGSVILRAVFPNPDHLLLPGMYVQAELVTGVNQQAILAPQQGITRNSKGEATAMVVNDKNIVEARVLQAERTSGSTWLVNAGLKSGDRLITQGLQYIKPGVEVNAQPADNLGKPQSEPKPASSEGATESN